MFEWTVCFKYMHVYLSSSSDYNCATHRIKLGETIIKYIAGVKCHIYILGLRFHMSSWHVHDVAALKCLPNIILAKK